MTNKVKPFYIRITDDMTPQIALEVKDKCTNKNVSGDFHFNPSDIKRWKYLGVCSQDGLCYSDFTENFYGNSQEITLDQLDEWLGLEVELEWKNGDECIYKGDKAVVIGAHPNENTIIIDSCISGLEACDTEELSKPETPEQKAERERLEAAYDLYCEECKAMKCSQFTFNEFKDEQILKTRLLAIVDKTNYRKQ